MDSSTWRSGATKPTSSAVIYGVLLREVAGTAPQVSHDTIEDACAFARVQLLEHQPDRRRNWRRWLYVVAVREAAQRDRQAAVRSEDEVWGPVRARGAPPANADVLAARLALVDALAALRRVGP